MKAIQQWPSYTGKGKSHPCQSRSQALQLCSKTKRAAGAKSCSTKVYDDRHKSSSCNVLLALALENSHSVAQPLQMTARAKEAVALLEYGGERHCNTRCGCKQPGDLPPSGGGITRSPCWLPSNNQGRLGGVHTCIAVDSSVLKRSLSSVARGPVKLVKL